MISISPTWKILEASPYDIKSPLTSKASQTDFAYAKQTAQKSGGCLCLSLLQGILLKRKYWLVITFNRNKISQNEMQSISQTQTSRWIQRYHPCSPQSLSTLNSFGSLIVIILQWQVCQIFSPHFMFILIPIPPFSSSSLVENEQQLLIMVPLVFLVISTLLLSDYKP